MKYLIFLFPLIFMACPDNDVDEFKKSCPYELKYSGHYLKVPITITPHKLTYKIGDTIKISTIFTDSIEDLGTQQVFKIEGFPFKPISLLYRFYDGLNWDAGFRLNDLYVDSIYNSVYNYSSNYADGFKAYTIYEDDGYKFEFEVVLKETGRYLFLISDLFQDHNGGGNPELNAEANAITFEGKCPTLQYYICSVIEGDAHLELFEDELVYLDEEIYFGNLGSIENSIGILKSGGIRVEFSGFFGFEVEE